MANRYFTQFYGSLHKKPVQLDCSFTVASTAANGLGIKNLYGPGIANVFMNTSPTATTTTSVFASGVSVVTVASLTGLSVGMAVTDSTTGGNITSGTVILQVQAGNNSIQLSKPTAGASAAAPGDTLSFLPTMASTGNPNPAAGFIYVQLQDNFYSYLYGCSQIQAASGSNVNVTSGLTQYKPYVITALGTTTAAAWVTLGLPIGTTAAVGVAFIAATSSAGTGTGTVALSGVSGITSIEVVGNPDLMINSSAAQVSGSPSGSYIIYQCLAPTSSSVTTLIPTAPAAGSTITLGLYMSNSSVTVQGG